MISKLFMTFALAMLSALASCGKNDTTISTTEEMNTTVSTDSVRLLYMGQGSIRITTGLGRVIYIDPYAGQSSWYELPADLILVTHEHFDHSAVNKVTHRKSTCRIIRARDAVVDGQHQTFNLDYVTVEAVEAGYNSYHDMRQCTGYVLTFNNGKKVYVSGDTSTTQQMSRMWNMHIDYAFLCTDGLYNMDNEEAARAAVMIAAKHNIPYHNDTSNSGEMFDRSKAERWTAPNKLIVQPGETINL